MCVNRKLILTHSYITCTVVDTEVPLCNDASQKEEWLTVVLEKQQHRHVGSILKQFSGDFKHLKRVRNLEDGCKQVLLTLAEGEGAFDRLLVSSAKCLVLCRY